MVLELLSQMARPHNCSEEQKDKIFGEVQEVLQDVNANDNVRAACIKVLYCLYDRRALEALLPLTTTGSERLRSFAGEAVRRIQQQLSN